MQKTIKSKAVNDIYRYVNNEYGDCIELTIERPYETVSYTYEYAYDEWDNWVRRLQFKNGAFDCAALRTLTYHKAGKTVAETSQMDEEDMPRAKASKSEKKGFFAKIFKKKDKAAPQPKVKAKKSDEQVVAEPKAKKEKASAKDEQPKAKVSNKGDKEPKMKEGKKGNKEPKVKKEKAKKEKADKPKEKKAKVKKNDNNSSNTPEELKSKPSKKDKVSKYISRIIISF